MSTERIYRKDACIVHTSGRGRLAPAIKMDDYLITMVHQPFYKPHKAPSPKPNRLINPLIPSHNSLHTVS